MADGPTAIAEAQKRALEVLYLLYIPTYLIYISLFLYIFQIAAKITASGGVTNGGGDGERKGPLITYMCTNVPFLYRSE